MFSITFGSCSGSFAEDTLKKEKQGFSSSYATDTGLKSDANGKFAPMAMQENYLLLPPILPSPCKPMHQV